MNLQWQKYGEDVNPYSTQGYLSNASERSNDEEWKKWILVNERGKIIARIEPAWGDIPGVKAHIGYRDAGTFLTVEKAMDAIAITYLTVPDKEREEMEY